MAGPYLSLLVCDSKSDKLVNDLNLELFWTWVRLPPPPPFFIGKIISIDKVKPETMWKIFNLVLAVLIMPLAAWVWSVNVEVAQLRNDLGDLESNLSQIEDKVKGFG